MIGLDRDAGREVTFFGKDYVWVRRNNGRLGLERREEIDDERWDRIVAYAGTLQDVRLHQ